MNCFVIMPYAREFDDVYSTIKTSVEAALTTPNAHCFRLSDTRPAGRITDRLLRELKASSICVADLTGTKPNVMWEVGFAMALEKPIIIITQQAEELPFDIKDMQHLVYDRSHLSETLGRHLKQMVIDTMQAEVQKSGSGNGSEINSANLVGELLNQVNDLKSMVSNAVSALNLASGPKEEEKPAPANLSLLQGAWVNLGSRSHLYARIVDNDLLVPYCYGGDNELTGIYYNWKRMGDYWFARFCWMDGDASGFAFLKQESVNSLTGAWWMDDDVEGIPTAPLQGSGEPSRWERKTSDFPDWADRFLEEVERDGLASYLMKREEKKRNRRSKRT